MFASVQIVVDNFPRDVRKMYWSLRFVIVVFNIFVADCGRLCENREHGCCSGQVWNETLEMCTDCTTGYTGKFCDIRCQYPYYGIQCLMKCDPPHSRDHYDFKTGCAHKEFTVLFTSPVTDYSTVMQRTDSDDSTNKPIVSMDDVWKQYGMKHSADVQNSQYSLLPQQRITLRKCKEQTQIILQINQ
ncbi:uncharacterized protein LOC125677465 [Ostrea edulis]|uniref:uncharacterized protein LOC125677465 n=1 Tax=Ostrea edulis TaxID=37623 RepID=UPI0024AE88B7|nr:uncharacterized protein LOC125677465 [Ostrea edulis]